MSSTADRIAALRKSYERAELSEDASQADPLKQFDQQRRRLQRNYADVRAAGDAAGHVDLVDQMLRKARSELRSKRA